MSACNAGPVSATKQPQSINLFVPIFMANRPVRKFPKKNPSPRIANRYPWIDGANSKYSADITGAPVKKLK